MGDADKPALEPYAAATIAEFRAQGIEPTIEEIIRLNDAARLLSTAARDVSATGIPIVAGDPAHDVWLWPTTIQADRWYSRASRWFDGEQALETLALAFAMAHARMSGVFDRLMSSPALSREAVEEWANTLPCTYAELINAISGVIEQAAPNAEPIPGVNDDTRKDSSFSSLVALLSDKTGIEQAVWERHVSRDYIIHHVNAIVAQSNASEKKISDSDPLIIAERLVGRVEMAIREAHAVKA